MVVSSCNKKSVVNRNTTPTEYTARKCTVLFLLVNRRTQSGGEKWVFLLYCLCIISNAAPLVKQFLQLCLHNFFGVFLQFVAAKTQNFSIFLNARERKHICTVDKFSFWCKHQGRTCMRNFLANVNFAEYLPIVFSRLETLRSPQSTLPIRLISKTINKVYQTQKANENGNKRLALQ